MAIRRLATGHHTVRLAYQSHWRSGLKALSCSRSHGNFHRTVTTTSKEAQAYFDQGMRLLWAFNHDESSRSFAKAAQIDPGCAMCLWGVALTGSI